MPRPKVGTCVNCGRRKPLRRNGQCYGCWIEPYTPGTCKVCGRDRPVNAAGTCKLMDCGSNLASLGVQRLRLAVRAAAAKAPKG